MGRPAIPPADRLILSLVKYGGSAPLTTIRANFYGRLTRAMFNEVLVELGDLIVVEKTRARASKRPTTSVILTWKGEVAARILRPSFRRRRLPVCELKVELAERRRERHPWATKMLENAQHVRDFERQQAAGWTWHPPKPVKATAAPSLEISAPKAPVPDVFKERHDYHPDPRNNAAVTPATPAQPRPESFAAELARIQGSQLAGFAMQHRGFDNSPQSEPRAATGESRSEVVARARASGHFFDGAFHTFDNRIVSWQEWAAWALK
jgi:hypothetical protein